MWREPQARSRIILCGTLLDIANVLSFCSVTSQSSSDQDVDHVQTMRMILTKIVATILCFGIVSAERITSFGVEWTHLEQQGANNRSGDQIWSSERWPDIFANSPYHTSCSREWRWLIVCTIVQESYIVCRTKKPMYVKIAGFCDYKNEFPYTYRFSPFSRVPRLHIVSLFLFLLLKETISLPAKMYFFSSKY